MVFDKQRLFIGILIILAVLFFYLAGIDYIFYFLIIYFIGYDLYKSNFFKNNIFKYLIPIMLFIIVINFFYLLNIKFFLYLILLSSFLTILINNYVKVFFVISIFFFSLILFNFLSVNRDIFFLILMLSFINDSFAYLFGKTIKGPLILPSLSPNKTWSGTLMSTFTSFLILFNLEFSFLLSLLLSISFFIGDIFFSYIKRISNIKDFSNLLPGHGGILDRLDSMYFAFIIMGLFNL